MQIVHVIPPYGSGDRHEERFPDEWTSDQILAAFRKPRQPNGPFPMQYGYGVIKDQPDDETGVCYLDHPGTRVVIGRTEKKKFIELKTIQGPEARP